MRKFILAAMLAAAVGIAFLPSQADASWLSQAIHQARGDYSYAPSYDPVPVPVPVYPPGYYQNVPPVEYRPGYYVAPTYPYGYSGYTPYYPRQREGWRGHDRGYHGEHREGHGDRHHR